MLLTVDIGNTQSVIGGLVRRIFNQLGYEATVVATGGLAPLIAQHSSTSNT